MNSTQSENLTPLFVNPDIAIPGWLIQEKQKLLDDAILEEMHHIRNETSKEADKVTTDPEKLLHGLGSITEELAVLQHKMLRQWGDVVIAKVLASLPPKVPCNQHQAKLVQTEIQRRTANFLEFGVKNWLQNAIVTLRDSGQYDAGSEKALESRAKQIEVAVTNFVKGKAERETRKRLIAIAQPVETASSISTALATRADVANHIDEFDQIVRRYFQWNQIERLMAEALERHNQQNIDDGGEAARKLGEAAGNRNQARADLVKLSGTLGPELAKYNIDSAPMHTVIDRANGGGGPPKVAEVWPAIRSQLKAEADKLRAALETSVNQATINQASPDVEATFRILTICGKQWSRFIEEKITRRDILSDEFCAFTQIDRGPSEQKKSVRALLAAGRVESVCAAIAHHLTHALSRIHYHASMTPTMQQRHALLYNLNSILTILDIEDPRVEARLKRDAVEIHELKRAITEIDFHDPDFRVHAQLHIRQLEKVAIRLRRYNDLMREASEIPGCNATAAAIRFFDKSAADVTNQPNESRDVLPVGSLKHAKVIDSSGTDQAKASIRRKLKRRKVWIWRGEEALLNEVARHLGGLVNRSPRTIKEWSVKYEWSTGAKRPDDRAVAVRKQAVFKTLEELGLL